MKQVRIDKKKMVALGGMLALIFAVGIVSNQMADRQSLETTKGYEEYETDQMDLHDGQVLVDSISLRAVAGTSDQQGDAQAAEESAAGAEATSPTAVTAENGAEGTTPAAATVTEGAVETVTSDDLSELENADSYFDEVRATINMDRNEVLSMLTAVIEETPAGAEQDAATQQKLKIIGYMDTEKTIESLIENKGFAEALVVITDSSVTVTVNKADLNQEDVAKISDIVMRETGRSADQIVIQSKF
ncbi:MAG: SpoIIIAH-like family protein [Bacillota bacterium]|nr:SpoIIIAH-like family protein [Bacillota bacterium]